MLLYSFIFLFFHGYVSAFGTTKKRMSYGILFFYQNVFKIWGFYTELHQKIWGFHTFFAK